MSWSNLIEPPRRVGGEFGGMITGGGIDLAPGATAQYQTFPEVPEKVGGGIGGNDRYDLPSEEYMDIANNVALSKHYAHNFMENWPLYLGGTAVVLYLLLK
jgi:hypothetical protein